MLTEGGDLKAKLSEVEQDIRALREQRAEAAKARDDARDTFARTDGYDVESAEFKSAEQAVRAVGEIDDRIADAQSAQIGILRMLGSTDPAAPMREQGERSTGKARNHDSDRWNSAGIFTDEDMIAALRRASSSKAHVGSIRLGEVATREALKADIAVTADMRAAPWGGVQPALRRQLTVLDLLPTGAIDGNVLPYTQEGGSFDDAAEVAEGDVKPEAGVTFTDATAPVQTIAVWMKIRKQVLADVAALQTIIDSRLRYSVLRRLEGQVLAGDGDDPNLRGILNTTGIGAVTAATGAVPVEQVLRGITTVLLADAQANGVVLHPLDWQNVLLMKATTNEYISGGPFSVTPNQLWGVPLTYSRVIPQGTALVGDFAIGATLLIREGVSVLLSDSDQDDFIRNRVTMLAEMRAALPVWRPSAFARVALAAA